MTSQGFLGLSLHPLPCLIQTMRLVTGGAAESTFFAPVSHSTFLRAQWTEYLRVKLPMGPQIASGLNCSRNVLFSPRSTVRTAGESARRAAAPAKSQDLCSFGISNHRGTRPASRLGTERLGNAAPALGSCWEIALHARPRGSDGPRAGICSEQHSSLIRELQ